MTLEYAPRGLVGMLTPQANTTVEPEFNILWPRGVAMINARLMSGKASMTDRLVDYFDNYGASLKQFANAPVGVVAAACTGASYLAGREREAQGDARDRGTAQASVHHRGFGGGRCVDGAEGKAASVWYRPIPTI